MLNTAFRLTTLFLHCNFVHSKIADSSTQFLRSEMSGRKWPPKSARPSKPSYEQLFRENLRLQKIVLARQEEIREGKEKLKEREKIISTQQRKLALFDVIQEVDTKNASTQTVEPRLKCHAGAQTEALSVQVTDVIRW